MPPVQLSPIASTFLVAFYVLTALILVVLLGAVVFLVLKLNALLEKYEQKIDPLLAKADVVLTTTTEKVNSIGTKAEEILTQGEELTEMVHSRVDTTTLAVHRTVFTPLIGVNSLIAGVKRGAEIFTQRQQKTITDALPRNNITTRLMSPSIVTEVENREPDEDVNVEPVEDTVNALNAKKILKVDETMNLPTTSTVNSVVNKEAETQFVTVGSRKENR